MLDIHADGSFPEGDKELKSVEEVKCIKRKFRLIIGSDGLIGPVEDENITLVEVKNGTAKLVLNKTTECLDYLDKDVIPVVVIATGSFNISVHHYGRRNFSHSNATGVVAFEMAAVEEITGAFGKFKKMVYEKKGMAAFAYLCPLPTQQSIEVSSNSVPIQESLSRIFVCANNMIQKLNWLVTPNTKKHLEKRGNVNVLMRNREQKRMRKASYTADSYPTPECQFKMMKECTEALRKQQEWIEPSC